MDDLLSIINRLVPKRDGDPYLVRRAAVVSGNNADGTVDITLSGVSVPGVPVLAGSVARQGDTVQVLSWQGGLMVLGSIRAASTAPTVRTLTSSGTWTKPGGLVWLQVEVQGGGGAGGRRTTGGNFGSGGGGGGYARKVLPAAVVGNTVSVTVGTGGAGTAASDTGGSGGASTFPVSGGTNVVGNGGAGGTAATGSTATGGSGGTGTGGDLNVTGGTGGGRGATSSAAGGGGGSFFGGGAPALRPTVAAAGPAATTFGGGGAGSFGTASNQAGGDGAGGIVIVTEHYQ